jgi:hypothetical protein
MQYKFCPELNIAVNTKSATDAIFARLCEDVCAGTTPFSKSAMLSAMEHCDDAMAALWVEARRVMHEDSSLVPIKEDKILPGLMSNLENRLRARAELIASFKIPEIADCCNAHWIV